MNSFGKAPHYEERHSGRCVPPRDMMIDYTAGPVPSLRAAELSLDTWDDGVATIGMKFAGEEAGVFVEQRADDLRAMAAACLRAAFLLDGGSGLQ